jgi:hypothetical protein
MNTQDAFNTIVAHLRQQGKPAKFHSCCRYRLEDLKCAIGCLIPDSMYVPGMEGRRVSELLMNFPDLNEHLADVNLSMLLDIQLIHDNLLVSDWEPGFVHMAHDYNLEINHAETK